MVWGARGLLGLLARPLREEHGELPSGDVVAKYERPDGGRDSCVQIPPETRGPRLGQLWVHSLGSGGFNSKSKHLLQIDLFLSLGRRMEQQHRVERWPAHPQTIQPCNRKVP